MLVPLADYPPFFARCLCSNEEAMKRVVKSHRTVASGFATSEPHTFYQHLWDFIRREDIVDLRIRQALFMAPHPICVGDALSARGRFGGPARALGSLPLLGRLAQGADVLSKKLSSLSKLIEHYRALQERRISFCSAFIGPASNIVIPDNPLTRLLYPEFVGRNTTRMGITDMQSIHFPDAVESMGHDPDGNALVDAFVMVMTPPDQDGLLSHGAANGANGEILEKVLEYNVVDLLLYINPNYPNTRGYSDAPNTVSIGQFQKLAEAGRLLVVEDQASVPSMPAGSFANPSKAELAIAEHLVNHIEMNKRFTYDRAIQVGIGGTGVQAIRKLKESGWHGRSYSEMLEPFTLELLESGKISGSHFIEKDGRRTPLDGRVVATFSMAEEGSDFYRKLDQNNAIVLATASRVVIPEAFYGGLGINNCLGIDFHGHVNSAGHDSNHHSGIGGGAVILRGLANGGVGYLCLKSTHRTAEGKLRSSIFPFIPAGTPLSHVGADLMGGRNGARFFLVTEHGVAQLSGKTQSEFIRNIIGVADPRFRERLKKEAYRHFRVSA